ARAGTIAGGKSCRVARAGTELISGQIWSITADEIHLDRPAEALAELDEVARADGAVAVEVQGIVDAAEVLAEDDEVVAGHVAVAGDVAIEADQVGRGAGAADQLIIVAAGAVAVAVEWAVGASNLSGGDG